MCRTNSPASCSVFLIRPRDQHLFQHNHRSPISPGRSSCEQSEGWVWRSRGEGSARRFSTLASLLDLPSSIFFGPSSSSPLCLAAPSSVTTKLRGVAVYGSLVYSCRERERYLWNRSGKCKSSSSAKSRSRNTSGTSLSPSRWRKPLGRKSFRRRSRPSSSERMNDLGDKSGVENRKCEIPLNTWHLCWAKREFALRRCGSCIR